ncbi:uncharacterized protein C8orf88 homolog isoform 1-T2 [Clarias gariepinus]
MMEVSMRRMRNLEPARPLRRLNKDPVVQTGAVVQTGVVAEPDKKPAEISVITVQQVYEILKLHSHRPEKKERISYSREMLMELANSPLAKRKPDFLPIHPIVLEKGRELNTDIMFDSDHTKKRADMDMVPA